MVRARAGMAIVCAMLVWIVSATPAQADVTDRSAGGFTVKIEMSVAAPPETVYVSLVRHVGEWWDAAHTYSGDAKNLSIVAEPGGCFCEALPNGGGVQHATVVNVAPGSVVRMSGGLGPLQAAGATGALSWVFEKSGSAGTRMVLTYAVGGYLPGGLDKVADVVDTVLRRQAELLKTFAEHTGGRR